MRWTICRDRPERSDAAGVHPVVSQPVGQKRRDTVHRPGQFRTAGRTDREFRCRAERTADGIEAIYVLVQLIKCTNNGKEIFINGNPQMQVYHG